MNTFVFLVRILIVILVVGIAMLIYSSLIVNEKLKLASIFLLGICLMALSFLGGFSIGKFTVLITIYLWFYVLTTYKNLYIRITVTVLLLITLVEAVYLL